MSDFSQFYFDNGYAVAKGVFKGEVLEALQADFDRAVAHVVEKGGTGIGSLWSQPSQPALAPSELMLHVHNLHQISGTWLRALVDDRLILLFQDLLGPDVILHHTKLFQKPARTGAVLPLHQDWAVFPTYRDSMCAAIVHLSDSTDEMGCLRVVPRSHHHGRLQRGQGNREVEAMFDFKHSIALEAEAGDVIFFNYLTFHGSMANRSDKARKLVIIQTHAGDDEVELGVHHPNERLVLSGWNSGVRLGRDLLDEVTDTSHKEG